MGVIQNIIDWIERKKTKKLIGEAKENPLETMKKLVKGNPDKVEEFIQELIADKEISDKIIVDLLKQAPEDVLLHTLGGLAKLDDEVNINKNVVGEVIDGIVDATENIDNVNYPRVKEAIKNVTPEEKEKEALEGVNKINSIMCDEAKSKLDEIYNNDDLYKPVNDKKIYFKIKKVMDNKKFEEIPEEVQEKINNIIAKIRANEFYQFGSIIIKTDLDYIYPAPEELLRNNIPQLVEEEYEKLPNKSNYDSKEFLENTYKAPKLKIAVINQIMKKIAFKIAHDDERRIEQVMEYIRENNPDLNEEEIDHIEQVFLNEMENLLIANNKKFDEKDIRMKINGTSKKQEMIESIYNSLKNLPQEELKAIQELLEVSKEFRKEEIGEVTNILKKYINKAKDNKMESKEIKEKELPDDEWQR